MGDTEDDRALDSQTRDLRFKHKGANCGSIMTCAINTATLSSDQPVRAGEKQGANSSSLSVDTDPSYTITGENAQLDRLRNDTIPVESKIDIVESLLNRNFSIDSYIGADCSSKNLIAS